MKKIYRILILILAVCTLTGCAGLKDTFENAQKLSEAGVGSQWVNSSIEGVIDEDYQTDYKTDFYTAVNKDWILEQELDSTEQCVDLFKPAEVVEDRKLMLINDPDSTGYAENTEVGLNREELEHAGEIVAAFVGAVGDENARREAGVEPLRPYLDRISEITTLDDFTDYMLDLGGMNVAGAPLVYIHVDNTMTDIENYQVILRPIPQEFLSLGDSYAYSGIDAEAIVNKQENSAIVRDVLQNLGYSNSEINRILRQAYRLEIRLAEKMKTDSQMRVDTYETEFSGRYPIDEIEEMTGAYPLSEIIDLYGYTTDEYTVFEPDYMKTIGEVYCEKNLEELKSYYIMKTIYATCDLLDPDTKDRVDFYLARGVVEKEDKKDTDTPEIKWQKKVVSDYVDQYMRAPFEMMYIGAYCSADEKEKITEMALDVQKQLIKVISGEDWLSEEGRRNAVEKLDSMKMKVLYPDYYFSYMGLDLDEGMSLIEMASRINYYEKCKFTELVGKKYDRNMWDLSVLPTSEVNAYNDITSNSMMILAGYVAGGLTFDPDRDYEINLAKLGTTIGHEMTHGLDSTGYKYDKNGRDISYSESTLLTTEDELELLNRSFKMTSMYITISPMPGVDTYGASISGEAIADMGGMKCAMYVAAEREHFDYDLFFRSYAELWRKKVSRKVEELYAQADEHPLAFLRTNVTLQQFDEFLETYDVKPGDGMYLDPDKRILVW